MNNHFEQKKRIYESMIDFGVIGSDENYSISSTLPNILYKKEEISMSDYLKAWNNFLNEKKGNLSLYVHVPYCIEKCAYCYTSSSKLENESELEEYIDRLICYLNFFEEHFRNEVFDNLYVGGGDPGILSEKLLDKLMKAVFSNFEFRKNGERTVENDPRTTNEKKLKILKKYGINRLSIRVQSFNEEVLELSNRIKQKEKKVREVISDAKKIGFDIINVDLMIGLYEEDEKSIIENFEKLAEIGPDRISIYPLQPQDKYLKKVYKKDRSTFFKIRKKLYKKSVPEILNIAKKNDYDVNREHLRATQNANDANSIAFKKENSSRFKTNYVAYPVDEMNSILGVGHMAMSRIGKKMECNALRSFAEEPENYNFVGYLLSPKEQLIKHIITNLSYKSSFSLQKIKDDYNFSENLIEEVKTIFEKMQDYGVVEINESEIKFKVENPREKLLYTLFLFEEKDVMSLLPDS